MRLHPSSPRRASRPLVHVATGYAISVNVSRGRLVIQDGVGRERRRTEYARTDRLTRLVVHGSNGSVTLDAVRWLTATGAALIHVDHAGQLQATTFSVGSENSALRRAQALAADRPVGVVISREILDAKLAGQRDVAVTLDADEAAAIDHHRARLKGCETLDELRLVEAQAAAIYWAAWRGVQVRFATRDADRVPVHWTTFTQRASLLTGTPRTATDPICAILNYLYAIVEAEARIALLAVGLDPGLGIIHTDQRSRDSLALDLMEVLRPDVDRYVLDLLARRPLSRKDVHETPTGQCRLLPQLAKPLAETGPTWASGLAPHAERITARLAADAGLPEPATSLTGDRRRQVRPASNKTGRSHPRATRAAGACEGCGTPIPAGQKRCRSCHRQVNEERMRTQQAVEHHRRQSTGIHPSSRLDVRNRIAESQRAQWQTRKASPVAGGFTGRPSEFERLILPRIARVTPATLAKATGLSTGYCAQIRDGKRVPHIRHWPAIQLAGLSHQP
jgi:CRISPR-associated endonuclease Cas1